MGREVLLKNAIQAIPTYAMNVFLLPKDLCSEIERTMNAYFWGCQERGGRDIQWKAWNYHCAPKKMGGMCFRRLREFNLAMLGKQAWRLIQNLNLLEAIVYKAKYFPKSTYLGANLGSNLSFI